MERLSWDYKNELEGEKILLGDYANYEDYTGATTSTRRLRRFLWLSPADVGELKGSFGISARGILHGRCDGY